jgi:acyl carrier protein
LNKIQEVIDVINETLEVDDINADSSMMNTPLWDSLAHMRICFAFERRFKVKLTTHNIEHATSVQYFTTLIKD